MSGPEVGRLQSEDPFQQSIGSIAWPRAWIDREHNPVICKPGNSNVLKRLQQLRAK